MVFRDDLAAAKARAESLEREVEVLRQQLSGPRRRRSEVASPVLRPSRAVPPCRAVALAWIVAGLSLAAPLVLVCLSLIAGDWARALGWSTGPLMLAALAGCGVVLT